MVGMMMVEVVRWMKMRVEIGMRMMEVVDVLEVDGQRVMEVTDAFCTDTKSCSSTVI